MREREATNPRERATEACKRGSVERRGGGREPNVRDTGIEGRIGWDKGRALRGKV